MILGILGMPQKFANINAYAKFERLKIAKFSWDN